MLVDRRLAWLNAQAAEMFGYARGEVIGRATRLVYPSDEAHEAFGRKAYAALAQGLACEGEVELRRKDGTPIWVRYGGRAIDPSDAAKGSLWVLTDVSRERALALAHAHEQAELERKQTELEALNRSLEARIQEAVAELRAKDELLVAQSRQAAMGEMIGHIAHQWRQPLNELGLILANLVDASTHGELDAAVMDEAAGEGRRLIQKMSATINDFRDFIRPHGEKAPFSLRTAVRDALALVAASFEHASIRVSVDGDADVLVVGFPNEYSQVLLCLLSNARDAILATGRGRGHVTIACDEHGGFGRLTVRDDGEGVPDALLARVFEPYFTTRETGVGIGLYISKQIVERSLGGRIEMRSSPAGTEVVVLTPLHR